MLFGWQQGVAAESQLVAADSQLVAADSQLVAAGSQRNLGSVAEQKNKKK